MEVFILDERLSGLVPPPATLGGQRVDRWSYSSHTPRESASDTLWVLLYIRFSIQVHHMIDATLFVYDMLLGLHARHFGRSQTLTHLLIARLPAPIHLRARRTTSPY